MAKVLCDKRSSLNLVRNGFAKAVGLEERPCKQFIIAAGSVSREWDIINHSIPI